MKLPQGKKNLTHEEEQEIIDWIFNEYMSYSPVLPENIIEFASKKCNKPLTKSFLKSFLIRNHNFLTTKQAIKIDDVRTSVTLDSIINYYEILENCSKDIFSKLIYNIDESGFSDTYTCPEYNAIIPK